MSRRLVTCPDCLLVFSSAREVTVCPGCHKKVEPRVAVTP